MSRLFPPPVSRSSGLFVFRGQSLFDQSPDFGFAFEFPCNPVGAISKAVFHTCVSSVRQQLLDSRDILLCAAEGHTHQGCESVAVPRIHIGSVIQQGLDVGAHSEIGRRNMQGGPAVRRRYPPTAPLYDLLLELETGIKEKCILVKD